MNLSEKKQNIGISVSICLFCYSDEEKKVLTVENEDQPFKGALILPNKALDPNKSLEEICSEILFENIGNSEIYVEQLNAFGKVYRHPNGRIIDISFYGLINLEKDKVILNEDNGAVFTSLEIFPEFAFDHNDMIEMALKRIKRRMKYRPLGKNLLPDQFTMNELEGLYASFLTKKFDKRNFRRRILEMDFLREVKKVQRNTRGRKAILYEFDPKKYNNYSKTGF
jgi:8-oxo-dGTP diphosphatase